MIIYKTFWCPKSILVALGHLFPTKVVGVLIRDTAFIGINMLVRFCRPRHSCLLVSDQLWSSTSFGHICLLLKNFNLFLHL